MASQGTILATKSPIWPLLGDNLWELAGFRVASYQIRQTSLRASENRVLSTPKSPVVSRFFNRAMLPRALVLFWTLASLSPEALTLISSSTKL